MRDKRIHLLKQYITENLQQEFSVDDLAAKVGLSKSRLTELFQKQNEPSPIRYVINVRLEEAEKLLKSEDFLHVNVIAERVGYRNLSNFIREFKKTYGTPPKQYRENMWSKKDSESDDEK